MCAIYCILIVSALIALSYLDITVRSCALSSSTQDICSTKIITPLCELVWTLFSFSDALYLIQIPLFKSKDGNQLVIPLYGGLFLLGWQKLLVLSPLLLFVAVSLVPHMR